MNSADPKPAWAHADRWIPLACLVVTGALLGLSTNLAKVASGMGVAALPFLFWSALLAALALGAVTFLRGLAVPLTVRTGEYYLIAALVSFAAPNLLLFSAVPHVGAGFAALAIAFPPLLTYLGALTLGIERFDWRRATGMLLALGGAMTLAIPKLQAPGAPTPWIIATLVAPVLLATGNLYRTLRWPPGARADALAPGMIAGSALLLIVYAWASGTAIGIDSADFWIVGIQALAFAIQYWLFFILQQRGGPVYLSLLGSVAAIIGVPVAILLLEESLPDGLAPAVVLIGLGVASVVYVPERRKTHT